MTSISENRPPLTLEQGVIKLMQQPGVADAVNLILEHASKAPPKKKAKVPKATSREERELAAALAESAAMAAAAEAGAAASMASAEPAAGLADDGPIDAPIKVGKANLPALEEMQAAGYMGTASSMRNTWAWARDHVSSGTYQVWPTPTGGVQEPLRFDAWGWPGEGTTCEEWINMLTYWTAMKEQIIGGASRSQRASVDSQLAAFSSGRRGR